jgi:hypothetical protein
MARGLLSFLHMNSSRTLRISGPLRIGAKKNNGAMLRAGAGRCWPALRRHVPWDWMLCVAMALVTLGVGASLLDKASAVAASYAQELRAVMVFNYRAPSGPNPNIDYQAQR